MSIVIYVPYDQADQTNVFAYSEDRVDFRGDSAAADRCTVAFAAAELRRYLEKSLGEVQYASAIDGAEAKAHAKTSSVADGSTPRHGGGSLSGAAIYLSIENTGVGDRSDARRNATSPATPAPRGSYSLFPTKDGVEIVGTDRVGVLYGAYHLLKLQGWRWYAPGDEGEIAPGQVGGEEPKAPVGPGPDKATVVSAGLQVPSEPVRERPDVPLCRGFDLQFPSMESAALLLWMARNRLSLARNHPKTEQLGRKLGMVYKNGGHIFEALLDPDRIAPSGKTFWDEHRQWYGLPESGVREKGSTLQTQFCVSQPDLLDFLAEELIAKIGGAWSGADLIDVWGFDTWGSCCTCESCKTLGNDTDQLLHMLSHFRGSVDLARRHGHLDHNVRLVGCAYEGTSSLQPPSRPMPRNLSNAGDCLTFYPIDRSYAFDFFDEHSKTNRHFAKPLVQWLAPEPRPNIIIGEYYNVSKYEDLPLVLTSRLTADIPAYIAKGIDGFTYMHPPMVNWSVRTITQNLYAALLWDATLDCDAFVAEFYDRWYGPHAEVAKTFYSHLETAWRFIAEWRAWHGSVLRALLAWDGSSA